MLIHDFERPGSRCMMSMRQRLSTVTRLQYAPAFPPESWRFVSGLRVDLIPSLGGRLSLPVRAPPLSALSALCVRHLLQKGECTRWEKPARR